MKKIIIISVVLIACLLGTLFFLRHSGQSKGINKSPEVMMIETFYRNYLTDRGYHVGNLFSKSYSDLSELESETCKEKAKGDMCGFGADGDVFLCSQEYELYLDFGLYHFNITEPSPGVVEVRLNVYPSLKDEQEQQVYTRRIRYMMIKEKGNWVIDDFRCLPNEPSDMGSAREEMQKTIQFYNAPTGLK